jgi:hypothetical protein
MSGKPTVPSPSSGSPAPAEFANPLRDQQDAARARAMLGLHADLVLHGVTGARRVTTRPWPQQPVPRARPVRPGVYAAFPDAPARPRYGPSGRSRACFARAAGWWHKRRCAARPRGPTPTSMFLAPTGICRMSCWNGPGVCRAAPSMASRGLRGRRAWKSLRSMAASRPWIRSWASTCTRPQCWRRGSAPSPRASRLGDRFDDLVSDLRAAKGGGYEWVSGPFFLDLTLRKPVAP